MNTVEELMKRVQIAEEAALYEGWEGGHCCKMAGEIIDAQAALASVLQSRIQGGLAFLLSEGALENATRDDYLSGRAQSNEQALYNILTGRKPPEGV